MLLGIVGGLGPIAHIEMEHRLVRAIMERYDSDGESLADQLYPPWVVVSVPQTPDRTAALCHHGPSPVPMVLSGLRALKRCSCDFALIPCNTTHAWIREIKERSPLPILDMVQATIQHERLRSSADGLIGLLATDGTLKSRIFSPDGSASLDRSLRIVSPVDLDRGEELQHTVMDCIYGPIQLNTGVRAGGIKSGIYLNDAKLRRFIEKSLCEVIGKLVDRGAHSIILGCTELPLVLNAEVVRKWLGRKIRLVDPMDVAAKVAIRIAAGEERLP
jgi:aspartate racemase